MRAIQLLSVMLLLGLALGCGTTNLPTAAPGVPTPTGDSSQPGGEVAPSVVPTLPKAMMPITALGYAAPYPAGWEVHGGLSPQDATGRAWDVIEYWSTLSAGGSQSAGLGVYVISVGVAPAAAGTITETVELQLRPMAAEVRNSVQRNCCIDVGGESGFELLVPVRSNASSRQITVLHDGREYRLLFRPWLAPVSSDDVRVQEAFAVFVSGFRFIPLSGTPVWRKPAVTPVPTA